MKALFFWLLILLATFPPALCQTMLKGKIQGFEKSLYAITPVNGKFVLTHKEEIHHTQRNFSISIASRQPGFVYIFHNFELIPVFYQPGMQSSVTLHKGKAPVFSGDFQQENTWFSQFHKYLIPYNSKHAALTDTLFEEQVTHPFARWKEMLQASLDDLEENCNDCHPLFKTFVRAELPYFYANELIRSVLQHVSPEIIWKDTEEFTTENWKAYQEFAQHWGPALDSMYQHLPLNSDALYSQEYISFLRGYYDIYRLGYKRERQEQFDDFLSREKVMIMLAQAELDTKPFEALYAFNLEFLQGGGSVAQSQEYIDLYEGFASRFPASDYMKTLKPSMQAIYAFVGQPEGNFVDKKILSTNRYNSFDDLLSSFKGQTVYVDLWATWCKPCLQEFEYSHDLYEFTEEKPIQLLYVSVDKAAEEEKWKKFISKYDLKGQHIRASAQLIEDIWEKVGDQGQKGYPRYIIVDAQGNIVEKDALRPSNQQILYQQLSSTDR